MTDFKACRANFGFGAEVFAVALYEFKEYVQRNF